jgi:2-dehydro-3-deoxy-D-arabinonate dehydratase
MTALVRSTTAGDATPRVGVTDGERVVALEGVGSMADLLAHPLADIRRLVDAADLSSGVAVGEVRLLPPIDGTTPVWAAGVTYLTSRDARIEESAQDDVFTLVYDAPRPELFFKAQAHHVVTDGDPVGRRSDSTNDTPEPELALVVNHAGEVVAYTVANDMSSRSIEGENPLYLPQAKIYDRSCALAATMRPAWEVDDPYDLDIRLTIERDGTAAWSGSSSTSLLHRRLPELVGYLFRSQSFPDGVILSTGTPLVPELTFRLQVGDVVVIEIESVGSLRNPVVEV